MTKISSSEITQIIPVLAKIKEAIITCPTIEEAAQIVVDTLYAEYSESIVLARMFATIAYKDLPPKTRPLFPIWPRRTGLAACWEVTRP